jgi:cysteinyl-tRNA synthetase
MSKSLGNFTTVHDLLEKNIKGEVMRFALLSAHYRAPLDWSQKLLDQTKAQLDGFYKTLKSLDDVTAVDVQIDGDIVAALSDDLNAPLAITRLHAIIATEKDRAVLKGQLLKAGALLGLLQEDPDTWLGYKIDGDTQWIDDLIAQRAAAKKEKNFQRADEIRNELSAKGIEIKDTPQGTEWRKI